MESFGDMTHRISEERAKALELETQKEMNAEILYVRQQRLRRVIVFVCNNLIKNNVPHLNIEVAPAITKQVPITNIWGKVLSYENEVLVPPEIIRGWLLGGCLGQYHDWGPDSYLYNIITEDGEYYGREWTHIKDGNIPQNYLMKRSHLSKSLLGMSKVELKNKGNYIFEEAEENLVNFAIDHNIDLSEIE